MWRKVDRSPTSRNASKTFNGLDEVKMRERMSNGRLQEHPEEWLKLNCPTLGLRQSRTQKMAGKWLGR
jgi:hypothetical protein